MLQLAIDLSLLRCCLLHLLLALYFESARGCGTIDLMYRL